eukprot:gene9422-18517_t
MARRDNKAAIAALLSLLVPSMSVESLNSTPTEEKILFPAVV